MKTPDKRRRKGFTLVELLATLVLIGLVMPTAMRGISLVTRMAGQSRRELEAVTLARSKLSELLASRDWETGGITRGTFGNDYPDYQWSWTLNNWNISPMEELTVKVTWDNNRQRLFEEESGVSLSTLVYASNQ